MKILPFQNWKIRNVFSYYGIIADDLVLYASQIIMTLSRSSQRNQTTAHKILTVSADAYPCQILARIT